MSSRSPGPGEDSAGVGDGQEVHTGALERVTGRFAAVAEGVRGSTRLTPAPADPDPTVRKAVRRMLVKAWDDSLFGESAQAAFWQTLSLPPLLLGLLGSLGYVGEWFGPDTVVTVQRRITEVAGNVFSPNAVEQIISPTVSDILTTGRGELVSVGFLISLWAGSSAVSSFVDSVTKAHDQYGVRNLVWQRLLAVLIYVVGLVVGVFALPVLALGPDLLRRLVPDALDGVSTGVLRWVAFPSLALLLVLALSLLFKVALPNRLPWRRGLPGAVLGVAVFLVATLGLRVYIGWVTSTGYTYGALAAPIAFLLATFFFGMGIVLGAQLNNAIQELWPAPVTVRMWRAPQHGPAEHEPGREQREGPAALQQP
ncbi:YihY/virulence factor BrkB family protein [Rhodococcus aerolatus]